MDVEGGKFKIIGHTTPEFGKIHTLGEGSLMYRLDSGKEPPGWCGLSEPLSLLDQEKLGPSQPCTLLQTLSKIPREMEQGRQGCGHEETHPGSCSFHLAPFLTGDASSCC